jgi:hypothetical protein
VLLTGQQPDTAQHPCVRQGSGDILLPQSAIDIE